MEETVQQKTGDVADILKILNRANESFAYEVFIPSLQKNVMFRQINTSQQKRLLKAIIDSPAYNTEFIFALRQIIAENCVDSIDVNNLTIYDKMIIAMTMRAMSISNDLDMTFTIPKTKDVAEQKITRRMSLKDLIDTALKTIKIEDIIIKDERGIYEIYCSLPTIYDEFKLEDELRKNVMTIEIKNENELRNTIGEVFINEIVKYVKKIIIRSNNEENTIDLKDVKFAERIKIIESIPAQINKQIIEYINNIVKEFGKVLLFKETINGVTVEERLKIDASFFTVS